MRAKLRNRIGEVKTVQVPMWACAQPGGPQQRFYAWLKQLSKELKKPELMSIFAIPNLGAFVTPHTHEELKLEGVKQESMDMFLPLPIGTKHGLFYSFKATRSKEHERIKRRALARSLIEKGYGVIFTYDWKYAALKTAHYISGVYEQDKIPEDSKPL
jgi:hypothetical protein